MSGVSSRDVDKLVIPSEVDYDGRLYKVYYISSDAFSGCSKIKEIFIPEKVSYIGERAFGSCSSLEKIVVDSNNKYYDSKDYILGLYSNYF